MSGIDLYYLLIPFLSLAIFFLWQVAGSRVQKKKSYTQVWIQGFLASFASTAVLHIIGVIQLNDTVTNAIFSLGTNLIVSVLASLIYLVPIQLGVSSQRVRILLEIEKSPRGLDARAILKAYNANDILYARLERMTKRGQVKFSDGKYFLGKAHSLVLLAQIYNLVELVLFHKKKVV